MTGTGGGGGGGGGVSSRSDQEGFLLGQTKDASFKIFATLDEGSFSYIFGSYLDMSLPV